MNPDRPSQPSLFDRLAWPVGRNMLLLMLALALLLAAVPVSQAQETFFKEDTEPLLGWPMREAPRLQWPEAPQRFDPRLGSLWFWALNQADSSTRFEAANAIAKAAAMGMPGLTMVTDRLTDMLQSDEEHPLTRLAAARALIALDAKAQAALLWQANETRGHDMIQLTDPALARWQHPAAIAGWRKRIADPGATLATRLSAIACLGVVKDAQAVQPLIDLAQNPQAPASLRMAAAKTLAAFAAHRVSVDDAHLDSKAALPDRLVTACLLSIDHRPEAWQKLVRLAGDAEPAVASIAGQALLAHQPVLLDPLVEKFSQAGDIALRKIAIERLGQLASPAAAEALAAFTLDPAPALRILARDTLLTLARDASLKTVVEQKTLSLLQGDNAFSQRQAALMAGVLKIEPAAPRLLELIKSADGSVALASASALRKLALPDTQAAALSFVEANMAVSTPYATSLVTAQLIQMFGQTGYAPAEPVLRKLIPKNSGAGAARHAAIWALGLLHAEKPDPKLIADLTRRANDGQGMNPEDGTVRELAVVAIARMKSPQAVKTLERWLGDKEDNSLAPASRWGIEHITGKTLPPLDPGVSQVTGWFLQPID